MRHDIKILKKYGVSDELMPFALFDLNRGFSHAQAAKNALKRIGL